MLLERPKAVATELGGAWYFGASEEPEPEPGSSSGPGSGLEPEAESFFDTDEDGKFEEYWGEDHVVCWQ